MTHLLAVVQSCHQLVGFESFAQFQVAPGSVHACFMRWTPTCVLLSAASMATVTVN